MEKNTTINKTHNQYTSKQSSVSATKAAGVAFSNGHTVQHCLIVGIGASAGGLQPLIQLFENVTDTTGMAFVVIQHLDANNDSALADILSRATAMPVSEVKDNTDVQPNHVYVIKPGTELSVSHGMLTATPRKRDVQRHTPIDSFLESLAKDQANKALGVILSGNGTDGAQGLKAVKNAGGITFTQTPHSAEYDSMPHSAIATGMVDFVMSPAEIAAELLRIGRSGIITGPAAEATELFPGEADNLNRIVDLLRTASGINFAEYKQLTIKRRIMRRMNLLKMDRLDDYAAYLQLNGVELTALQHDLLINVTQFFRAPQSFDILKEMVFPSIASKTAANSPIRMWVPGCSTGEEAYSLAIALLEYLADNNLNRRIQIFATDINETVIDKARAGIYPKTIVADISPARLSRFFVEMEQGFQVSKAIRDICVFARQDIGQDPPISRVDLICCRNVMIYFGPALHKRLFPLFHYALNPHGFLMLGASESIGLFADLFELTDKKHRIFTKKSVVPPMLLDFTAVEHAAALQNPKTNEESISGNSWLDIQKEADRIVLGKYAPSGVIINSKLDIIQFRGRTGVYLEPAPGLPSANLLKMARDGLLAGLRASVHQAQKENVLVRKEGLRLLKNGHFLQVDIDVVPINGPFQKGEYFLILFRDATSQPAPDSVPASGAIVQRDLYPPADDDVLRLNQEIAVTKEYLQSIIDQHEAANEDLRYANEQVQSSNEELQSMNEELETTKEELQSTNEELMTLNEELRTRNMEMSHIYNDMINLLRSINVPVLILSGDLRIKRFNSVAEKVFGLIGSDIGRPINNIKHNIDIPDLQQVSLEVIDTLNSKELEVQDRWGHCYSMQIRPYRTTDNMIDGVIITFVDIDAIKRNLKIAQDARENAEAILDTVRQPLLVLDADLRLKSANKAFFQAFQLTPEEVTGQSVFQIKNGKWAVPQLRTMLLDIREHDKAFEGFPFNSDHPEIGMQKMLVNARRMVNTQNNTVLILMAFELLDARPEKS